MVVQVWKGRWQNFVQKEVDICGNEFSVPMQRGDVVIENLFNKYTQIK